MTNITDKKLNANENNSKNSSHIQLSKLINMGTPGVDENVTGTH